MSGCIRRCVVTGPTGAVGTALIAALLAEETEVFAVYRPGSRREDDIPDGAIRIACDLKDLAMLSDRISGTVDAFFHLGWAGTIGPERDDMMLQNDNVRHALEAVNAAARLGCSVFVGTGSQAEYGPREGILSADTPAFPVNGYGIAKLCAGQMTRIACRQFGIRHVWARILSVYGPHDNPRSVLPMLMNAIMDKREFPLTKGEQEWDYLYSKDAARALIALANHGKDGRIYPLGSGKTHTLKWYFTQLRDAADPDYVLKIGQVPYPANQVMHLMADITDVQKDTGWYPEYCFEDGIRETVESARVHREKEGLMQ